MCLLLTQPAGHSFSEDWLADFYASNSDGIGVMYAQNGELIVEKLVPKTFKQLRKFYQRHIAGKACAVHFRMRTHGDIDLDNCHPYQVFGEEDGYPLWLMHNGVLSTGNAKDTTKSDTWHYINDIIRPALAGRPQEFMSEWFQQLIEDHIGTSNKFVMVDALGNMQTFNKDSGVMWGDVWMSNTYAWDAAKAGVTKPYNYYGGKTYYGSGYGGWDDDYYEPVGRAKTKALSSPKYSTESIQMQYANLFMDTLADREYWNSYSNVSYDELCEYYMEDPESAEDLLIALEEGAVMDMDILDYFDNRSYNKQFGYASMDTEDRVSAR